MSAAPTPPKGYDVSDWFKDGGTVEALSALVADAPEWEPTTATDSRSGDSAGARLIVTSMADVEPKPVDWLWPRYLARGKLHILGGHPGDGKSTVTAALAAIYSRGGALPDGSQAPAARSLFLLAEDALDDTFRPRLDAHGADPSQVMAIEAAREAAREADGRDRLFSLADHLPLLENAIVAHRVDVVVIDPLTSFMPRSDRNAEGDVRDALTPLGKLAERSGVAVLAIMHVGKPNGTGRRPLQQLLGATAFGAIARVVWMIAPCPDDDTGTRRVLGVVKSNLAIKPPALEWSRMEDGPIVWHGVSKHNLDDLLGGPQTRPRDDAEGFLRETLKGGAKSATDVQALAKTAGFSEMTLRRAADKVGVRRDKERVIGGRWFWSLPPGEPTPVHGDDDPDDAIRQGDHLPRESKVITPKDAQVITFDSSHESGKMITPTRSDHLQERGKDDQGDHLSMLGSDHLRPCVECGAPVPVGVAGMYCVRHGGTVADPTVASIVCSLLAFSPQELTAYRAELATLPPDDPPCEDELAALAMVAASAEGASAYGRKP